MNRAVSGTLSVRESGRPLGGLQVVAARLAADGLEVLGETISGDLGRFRVTYEPLLEPADLQVLIYRTDGRLLFAEPIHRAIAGAELRLQIEVPDTALRSGMH